MLSVAAALCVMWFARSIAKRYEASYVPWLRDTKFLHELEKDSVDSDIIDEELRSIQLSVTTTTYVPKFSWFVTETPH